MNGPISHVKELDFLLKAIGNYFRVLSGKWQSQSCSLEKSQSSEKPGLGRKPEVGRSAKRQEMLTQVSINGAGAGDGFYGYNWQDLEKFFYCNGKDSSEVYGLGECVDASS